MKIKIGFGTWNFSGSQHYGKKSLGWPIMTLKTKQRIINAVKSSKLLFIDTSDFYGEGEVEDFLGLNILPDSKIILATKGGLLPSYDFNKNEIQRNFSIEYLNRALLDSHKRLKYKTIDLYQLHGPSYEDLINPALWDYFHSCINDKKIKQIGVSLRKRSINEILLDVITKNPLIYSVQIPIDLTNDDLNNFAINLRKAGKIVIGRSPFMHGLLFKDDIYNLPAHDQRSDFVTSELSVKLRYLRSLIIEYSTKLGMSPGNFYLLAITESKLYDMVLFGASSPQHVKENIIPEGILDEEVNNYIYKFLQHLMSCKIPNVDQHDIGINYEDFYILN